MKNKKLKLEELKVESFVTKLDGKNTKTLQGGISLPPLPSGPDDPRCSMGGLCYMAPEQISRLNPEVCTRGAGTVIVASVVSLVVSAGVTGTTATAIATEFEACPSVDYFSCNRKDTCYIDGPTNPHQGVCGHFH